MSVKRYSSKRLARLSRRTQIVWGSFIAAMTVVTTLLAMQDAAPTSGFMLTNVETIGRSRATDAIFSTAKPVNRSRWTGIVIHQLGEPSGTADSIHRQHLTQGLAGLGYHFVIGNGNGLGDGVVHVGYRWDQQLAGAHVAGVNGQHHNQQSIGICLVGNGDRRPFSDQQIDQLVSLIHRLQAELNIPARNVHLHRELYSNTTSPGRFFPSAQFEQRLLD